MPQKKETLDPAMEISESPHKMHMPWGNFFRQAKMVSAYDVYMLAIILHLQALLTDSAYGQVVP
jgi:hypothetical protein